jgi:hypothetical protein
MHGRDLRHENPKERDHLEDLGIDERIMILKEIGWKGVALINLAPDRDQWWALSNAVMHLRVV